MVFRNLFLFLFLQILFFIFFTEAFASSEKLGPLMQSCPQEAANFCNGIEPGHGQLFSCLEKRYNDVNQECQKTLLELRVSSGWGRTNILSERQWGLFFVQLIFFAVVFSFIESKFPAIQKRTFWRKGFTLDLFYAIINSLVITVLAIFTVSQTIVFFGKVFGMVPIFHLLSGYGDGKVPIFLQGISLIVINDFCGYWIHRAFHTRWLWPLHAAHHSSENLDWLSNYRNNPINDFIQKYIQILVLVLLGLPLSSAQWLLPILVVQDAFAHANVNFNYGLLERWIVSPAFHRRHHLKIYQREKGCNYAGTFSIWDRIFGTASYYDRDTSEYGVSEKTS